MKTLNKLISIVAPLVASIQVTGNALPKKNKALHTIDAPVSKLQDSRYNFTDVLDLNIFSDSSETVIDVAYKAAINRLKQQAAAIKSYAQANHYNSEYCFLVDMSLPSGKNRFFVYNIKEDVLETASLVSHGFGSTVKGSEAELIFSNNNYSFKTSLGKYKIGSSYNGTYGLAYKLYGLDSTNSKAFQRAIVLHSDIHIPESEAYPNKIFQSAGCPAVSPGFLSVLSQYIKVAKKPILMWIYK